VDFAHFPQYNFWGRASQKEQAARAFSPLAIVELLSPIVQRAGWPFFTEF
jgi:hypothetical protein